MECTSQTRIYDNFYYYAPATLIQARASAFSIGLGGIIGIGVISSKYSMITFDSNRYFSPTWSTGVFPRGEILMNQSGLFLRSIQLNII